MRAQIVAYRAGKGVDRRRTDVTPRGTSKSMAPASSVRKESKSGSCADGPENNNSWKWEADR